MRPGWLLALLPALALPGVWFGCSSGSSSNNSSTGGNAGSGGSAGTPGTGGTGGSAGSPGGTITSYQPKGCGYTVTLPDGMEDATMDAPAAGAAPSPVHVHVSWASDTSSSFAVNWKTGPDTQLTEVVYGTDKAAVSSADGAGSSVTLQTGHTFIYGSGSPIYQDQKTRVHEVHVCGLDAGTTYYYKVGGAGHWSTVYDVATGPKAGAATPFRFAVAGDSRDDPATFASIEQKITTEAPDFQIFTGDAVHTGANQTDWDGFFEASSGSFHVEDALARIPFMPVNGNHENLVINYFTQFALPGTVSKGEVKDAEGEEWYSFDYANAHFVMLDDQPTGSALDDETQWLSDDLSKVDRKTTPWIFAVHHKPLYTASNHSSDMTTRAAWQPLYDQYKVDFVLNGHNHVYERTLPIRGFKPGTQDGALAQADANKAPVNESGTVYVVAGGAGAPLYGTGTDYFTALTEKTRNYVVIDIDGRTLKYTAKRLDGSELESFTYTK